MYVQIFSRASFALKKIVTEKYFYSCFVFVVAAAMPLLLLRWRYTSFSFANLCLCASGILFSAQDEMQDHKLVLMVYNMKIHQDLENLDLTEAYKCK